VGLADAGVDDLLRVTTGLKRAKELAVAGHIEPAAGGGEGFQDVDVPAAFDAVANGRVERFERLGDLAVVVEKGSLGVNVRGRAHLRRDLRGRDILAVQFAILVIKEVHKLGVRVYAGSPPPPSWFAMRRNCTPESCRYGDTGQVEDHVSKYRYEVGP